MLGFAGGYVHELFLFDHAARGQKRLLRNDEAERLDDTLAKQKMFLSPPSS